jgi:hypothetical protein
MKFSTLIILISLSLGNTTYSFDELADFLPQVQPLLGDAPPSEADAIQWHRELLQREERKIKETPNQTNRIKNEILEVLFRWESSHPQFYTGMIGAQSYRCKLINQHPEWVPYILKGCMEPIFRAFQMGWDERYASEDTPFQPAYFNSIELLPFHEGCTWENSREVYRRLLEQYRAVRQYINFSDWKIVRRGNIKGEYGEEGPKSSIYERYLTWMMRSIPGVLARFPTKEGVEELCQQLEAYPGSNSLAAANALSVCTSAETVERVKTAFQAARRIRKERQLSLSTDDKMPLEYQRLAARIANVNADLSAMPEGAGFRLIKPDWSAARDTTWNTSPAIVTSPNSNPPMPTALTVPTIPTPLWHWLLLLLAPAAWLARGAWDRHGRALK